jgi:GTP-binding protein
MIAKERRDGTRSTSWATAEFLRQADRKVYAGQIVGSRRTDMVVAVQAKAPDQHARPTSDIAVRPRSRGANIEQAIEWINGDELVEVTPAAIRVRKRILDHSKRKSAGSRDVLVDSWQPIVETKRSPPLSS